MSLLLLFAGAGTVLPGNNGSLNQTLGALTLSAAGQVIVSGSLSQTLGALTLSGQGDVGNTIHGTLDATLGALTLSGAGTVIVSGALAKTLGALTLSAQGTNGSVIYLRSSAMILGSSSVWLPIPFPPIATDEHDYRAFDITKDAAGLSVTETNWICQFRAGQDGSDEEAQSRIIGSSVHSQVITLEGPNNVEIAHNGFFGVALVGGFPETAIGCRYDLIGEFTLSDGRILSRHATILVNR